MYNAYISSRSAHLSRKSPIRPVQGIKTLSRFISHHTISTIQHRRLLYYFYFQLLHTHVLYNKVYTEKNAGARVYAGVESDER